MEKFPKHIILPDKVYTLSFSDLIDSGRAFMRELVDFLVELQNPLNHRDKATTYVGTSRELFDDYPSFRIPVPLEWVLGRFLAHHIRSNSLDLISGPNGEVLKTTTFKFFLGQVDFDDREVDRVIVGILSSWIRVFPEKSLPFSDIYVSTDIQISKIERGINGLIFMGYIEKLSNSLFKVLPKVLNVAESSSVLYPSEKSKSVEATKMPSIFLSHNS